MRAIGKLNNPYVSKTNARDVWESTDAGFSNG